LGNISVLNKRMKTWETYNEEAKIRLKDYIKLFSVIPNFQNLSAFDSGAAIEIDDIRSNDFSLELLEDRLRDNNTGMFVKKEENEKEIIFKKLFHEAYPPIHQRIFNHLEFKKAKDYFLANEITLCYLENKEISKGPCRLKSSVYFAVVDYKHHRYLFKIERFEDYDLKKNWTLNLAATSETSITIRSHVVNLFIIWFRDFSKERIENLFEGRKIELNHTLIPYVDEHLKKYINVSVERVVSINSRQLKENGYHTIYDLLPYTIEELEQLIPNQHRFIQTYKWVWEAGLKFKE
jgi:hypothetical protein